MKKLILSLMCVASAAFAQFNSSAPSGAVVSATNPNGATCVTATAKAKIYNGTIYTCQAGTYAQLAAGGAPSGSAGGDLTGTYPNPTVAKINGTALSGLATGLLKNTTTTGVPSIGGVGDVTGLFSGTCPANTTCVLGSTGVLQSVQAFPNANLRGTFLGLGLSNTTSAGSIYYPFADVFNLTVGCGSPSASYWLSPIGGYVRNVTTATSGANGTSPIHLNAVPGCSVPTGYKAPNGGVIVPAAAAAGSFVDTTSTDVQHINQYAPLAFGFERFGGVNSGIMAAAGAEFISDDGTADSILGWSQQATLTASSTQYIGFDEYLDPTESNIALPLPIAGTLKNFVISNTTSPTAAVTVTVNKNGVNSALTVTVGAGDGAGSYFDTTHTVSIAAGDYIDIQTVSGATTQAQLQAATLLFVPNDGTSALLHGQLNKATATTTAKYATPTSAMTGTTEANQEYASPIACSVSHLYVYQATANAGSTVTTFTLYRNGVSTALTGTIGVGVTGSEAVDTTHSVSLAQGDRISLQYVTNTGTGGTMSAWGAQCN